MTELYLDSDKLETAASRLRSIAHPMRLSIIALLQKKKTLNVTDIYTTVNIEQAAASHHLAILRSKGVLVATRVGKMTFYSVNDENLFKIIECIDRCNNI